MEETSVQFYSATRVGHRGAYLDFVQSLLGGKACGRFEALSSAKPLLFLMIEDSFAFYVVASLWRAALRRKTVGLLFRPRPAVRGKNLRLRLKRCILRLLKRIEAITTLSIVPIPLEPRMEEVVDGWIYDFQLWDLSDRDRAAVAELRAHRDAPQGEAAAAALVRQIEESAGDRRVLAAIGAQSRLKGFDKFAIAAKGALSKGWLFLAAGRVDPACLNYKVLLESSNALVIDRFVSDAELIAAYAACDAVWCLYDEDYDQASGILGRAAQFGLPVIVREGSLCHLFCRLEGLPHVASCGWDDVLEALSALPDPDAANGERLAGKFRAHSLVRLREALGLFESTER